MSALRKTVVILIAALLLLQALPAGAALESSTTYTLGSRWEEVVDGIRVEHRLFAGISSDGASSGAMLLDIRYLPSEDGTWFYREMSYRRMTDVTVTVSRDLSQATMSGKLDGADVSADFVASGPVQHEVIDHPSPWSFGMDGVDGVQVFIYTVRSRAATGTLTVGGAVVSLSGSIYEEMRKDEINDGQEPKEHVPNPKGPSNSNGLTN